MIWPLANVIEPLVFATGAQLLLGNFFIAWVESTVARRWLEVAARRMYWLALLANTVSATIGVFVLSIVVFQVAPVLLGNEPIRNIRRVVVFIIVGAFVLSVLMEWWFFHAAVPMARRSARRSLFACAVAQLASYALILPAYASLSTNTLGSWTISDARDVMPGARGILLFVSTAERGLYAMPLDGGPAARLLSLEPRLSETSNYLHLAKDADGRHVNLSLKGWNEDETRLGWFSGSSDAVARTTTAGAVGTRTITPLIFGQRQSAREPSTGRGD